MLINLMFHNVYGVAGQFSLDYFETFIADIATRFNVLLPGEVLCKKKMNVCLIFDDAYFDYYHCIFPILKRYQLKSVVAIPVDFVHESLDVEDEKRLSAIASSPLKGNLKEKTISVCTWQELKELYASGLVMPASHSCGHGMLTAEKNLQRELLSSKQIIEDKLSCRVNSFVLPYGNANRTVFNKAREHYQYLFRIGCAINVGWRSLSGYSYRIDADEFWAEGRLLPIKRKWYLNHIKNVIRAR